MAQKALLRRGSAVSAVAKAMADPPKLRVERELSEGGRPGAPTFAERSLREQLRLASHVYMLYCYAKNEQGDLTLTQARALGRLAREEFR